MDCTYCGAPNHEHDHRCHRCGRRLTLPDGRQRTEIYPVEQSRALLPKAIPITDPGQDKELHLARIKKPYQATLFTPRLNPTDGRRVVPIQDRTGAEQRQRPQTRKSADQRQNIESAVYQQMFSFQNTGGLARNRHKARQEVRCSNAPVAVPAHRIMAAAADFSMIAIAVGFTVSLLHFAAGSDLVNMDTIPYFGALGIFLGLSYKILWAVAGTDSPGLRWTRLRLLNFDGVEPTRAQRLQRIAAACLSLLSGGLGLIWAVVDEETLSWHDHMSKTFLTSDAGR